MSICESTGCLPKIFLHEKTAKERESRTSAGSGDEDNHISSDSDFIASSSHSTQDFSLTLDSPPEPQQSETESPPERQGEIKLSVAKKKRLKRKALLAERRLKQV